MSDADLKADILAMIACEFGTRQISNEFYAVENIDHEEPALLLDIFTRKDWLTVKDAKPAFRVRIDVTVTET